jgi:thiamine-monophosphate kinase
MLGGSFESGRHLDFVPRIREARFLVENASLSAMMDLSDGLGSDLPRLIEASGVGFRIDPEILPLHDGVSPGQAVCDGEDYELLLTMSQDEWSKIQSVWIQKYPETPLTHIGDITKETETPIDSGWEHFQEA